MDLANNILLPCCSKTQQFLIKLLCEYFEQKLETDNKEKETLQNKNDKLLEENENLKAQLILTKKMNNNLSEKFRAANNMIRILQDNQEKKNECTTPTMLYFPVDLDRALKEKFHTPFNLESSPIKYNVQNKTFRESVQTNQRKSPKKCATKVEKQAKRGVELASLKKIDEIKKSKAIRSVMQKSPMCEPVINKKPIIRKTVRKIEVEDKENLSKSFSIKKTENNFSEVKMDTSKSKIVKLGSFENKNSTSCNTTIHKHKRVKAKSKLFSDLDIEPIKEFKNRTFTIDPFIDA